MYIPIDDKHSYKSCKIKLLHEIFRHLNNQSLMKVPKCLKPKKIRKHDLKLWLPV